MATLREVGEFEAIRRLIEARPTPAPGVVAGAGHDAAVLRIEPGMDLVATTDAFVEGVHWRSETIDPAALGARLAAANLSDLAASAAHPRWGLISMGLRATHDLDSLLALDGGIARSLAVHGAALVGGNLASVEGPEWLSLTLLGACPVGAAWSRAGAAAGDLLVATGSPGRAAAALALFARAGAPAPDAWWEPLAALWRAPVPRVHFAGCAAAAGCVHAAIDISDGLAADLVHLARASGVGVELDLAAWPPDPLLIEAAARLETSVAALRLSPGDDYELLLAVPEASWPVLQAAANATVTPIAAVGRFTGEPALRWRDAAGTHPLEQSGWDHFAGR